MFYVEQKNGEVSINFDIQIWNIFQAIMLIGKSSFDKQAISLTDTPNYNVQKQFTKNKQRNPCSPIRYERNRL